MEVSVDEYTSPILVMINCKASIDKALEVMLENRIRHLPVEDKGKVVGIVSERDLLTHQGKNWTTMMTVEDIIVVQFFFPFIVMRDWEKLRSSYQVRKLVLHLF